MGEISHLFLVGTCLLAQCVISTSPGQDVSPFDPPGRKRSAVRQVSHPKEEILTCDLDSAADADFLLMLDDPSIDIWTHSFKEGSRVDIRVLTSAAQQRVQERLNCEVTVFDLESFIGHNDEDLFGKRSSNSFFDAFRSSDEMITYAEDLKKQYPKLLNIKIIGQTVEGRDIPLMIVSGPEIPTDKKSWVKASVPPKRKWNVYIQGGLHAREWASPATAMYLVENFLSSYGKRPDISWLMDRVKLHIAPVVNRDGYEYSRDKNRLWRKNRRKNEDGTFGVDLNRNFDYEWGASGASSSPMSESYKGPSPASEPEVQAVQDYLKSLPNCLAGLDLHSYGQQILHAWGWTYASHPDENWLENVGSRMSEAILNENGRSYQSMQSSALYPAAGATEDFITSLSTGHGWTVELRPDSGGREGFLLSPSEIRPVGEEILAMTVTWLLRYVYRYGERPQTEAPTPSPTEIIPVFNRTCTEHSHCAVGFYCDESHSCWSCSAVMPMFCDALGGEGCCDFDFHIQCPFDPAGCWDNCQLSPTLETYNGGVSTTASGEECVTWNRVPTSPLDEEHNYCRNPDKDPTGPWCFYTARGNTPEKGYCDVGTPENPKCSDDYMPPTGSPTTHPTRSPSPAPTVFPTISPTPMPTILSGGPPDWCMSDLASESRMAAGSQGKPRDFEFLASLQDATGRHICGGAVIAPSWILTSTSCLVDGLHTVVLGASSLLDTEDECIQRRKIVHTVSDKSGLALLLMEKPTHYSTIMPFSHGLLNENLEQTGRTVTMAGWDESLSNAVVDTVQQISIPLVSSSECGIDNASISSNVLCAGAQGSRTVPCDSDTGSPLFTQHEGKFYLLGITSKPLGCSFPIFRFHSLFMRVSFSQAFLCRYTGISCEGFSPMLQSTMIFSCHDFTTSVSFAVRILCF